MPPLHAPTATAAYSRWYREELGWAVHGEPPVLAAGSRVDALRLPAAAGLPLLARMPARHTGPALRAGGRVWLLIAGGAAAEVPDLLAWLEWGTLAAELGLAALGTGDGIPAPAPPGAAGIPGTGGAAAGYAQREAAVWLRPPARGSEGERTLPALPSLRLDRHGTAPDLVRLVDAAATECHRALLRRTHSTAASALAAANQPLAFS